MNGFYRLGIRQLNQIEQGLLDYNLTPSAAKNGELITTISALKSTINQYEQAIQSELIESVKFKSLQRLKQFQSELIRLTNQHNQLKRLNLLSQPIQSTSYTPPINYNNRQTIALKESDFYTQTNNQLDQYLQQGQAVLNNLSSQRDILKSTKTKLLSAANTLGLSRSTIQFIERRTKTDLFILIFGALFTLLSFYLILKYLG